jgi:hypothetical protein
VAAPFRSRRGVLRLTHGADSTSVDRIETLTLRSLSINAC